MRIETVRLVNFLSHGTGTPIIDLRASPLWLFVGPNGAGKTSVFEAVEFALYGRHRLGTRRHVGRLVRQGAEQAQIDVVFTHRSQRYRVTREISAREGNVGGSLYREEGGGWEPIREIGSGKQAVWEYVENHLMSYEHFCSGVYLHQDSLGYFLSEGPDKRGRRFASLMDLEDLNHLAEFAHTHSQEEAAKAVALQSTLEEYGDLSHEAVERASVALSEADEAFRAAQQASQTAANLERDAQDWATGQLQLGELDGRVNAQKNLLAEAEAIRQAATMVRSWLIAAPQLERFWNRIDEAAGDRDEAGKAQQAGRVAAEEADTLQKKCEALRQRLTDLQDTVLPELRQLAHTAEAESQALALESQIAGLLERARKAQTILDRLGTASEGLRTWEAARRAVPRLEEVAESRSSAQRLERQLAQARKRVRVARAERKVAAAAAKQTGREATDSEQACRRAQVGVEELERQSKILSTEIEKHRELSTEARRCPVCDRVLDRPARDHVRQAIKSKRASLKELRAAARHAESQLTKARATLGRATGAHGRAQARIDGLEHRITDANTRMRTLEARLKSEKQRLGRAFQAVQREAEGFGSNLDRLTSRNVTSLKHRLEREEAGVKTNARKHGQAQRTNDDAISQTQALGAQRVGEQPAGIDADTKPADIARLLARARSQVAKAQAAVQKAETEDASVLEELNQILPRQAAQATLADQKRLQGGQLLSQAEEAERLAAEVAIPEAWMACADSREIYEGQGAAVEELRPLAERLSALDHAETDLVGLKEQRRIHLDRLQHIPEAHRIVVEIAQNHRAEAGVRLSVAQGRRDGALQAKAQLEASLVKAQQLEQNALLAEHRHQVFSDLARLLGPDGQVQHRVIQSVQEEICRLANAILLRAGDSLEIQLGEPLRAGSIEKDLVFVDRQEPSVGDRLYEQLSAGEKTRVAMAIAAVIHGRASGGEVGTLIIDEAFGALDEDHRETYAAEVSDVSAGWLEQGLVGQIIVATHVSDVHRFFTAYYRITKIDGQAQVICSLP
jgi:exonuclease SbcC